MRRGKNNRWTYDLSPQSDGLVTVCKNGTTFHFYSIEELREHRNRPDNVAARTTQRLKRLGYLA